MANQNEFIYPLQTPEQSENTHLFLTKLVADTYGTNGRCLIMRQSVLKRNTYARHLDCDTGKYVYEYEDAAKSIRVIKKQKGLDWGNPVPFELAKDNELLTEHRYAYQTKIKLDGEVHWVHVQRPSLANVIATNDEKTKYLFYGALVRMRPLMELRSTRSGSRYWAFKGYKTTDAIFARCIWVDVDGHNLPVDEIRRMNPIAIDRFMSLLPMHCEQTGVPVPAVVNSGRGIHLYWWFDTAVDIRSPESQRKFKSLLTRMNAWVADFIARDDICSSIWNADSASNAIFHQMNLPGCIHPKTLTPRYVVNKYEVDYYRCSYDNLCETMNVADTILPLPILHTDVPAVTSICGPSLVTDIPEHADSDGRTPNCFNDRLQRLMQWATGRNWDLYPGREKFLFVCGAMIQLQAQGKQIPDKNHPLYAINAKLVVPLPNSEIEHIISELDSKAQNGTDDYSKYYILRNDSISEILGMSDAERQRFCQQSAMPYCAIPTFQQKLQEFLESEPWHVETESLADHRNRCYHLACQWFDTNRKIHNRNGSRSRRRTARDNYNTNGGRPRVDHSDLFEKCRALQEQGQSVRKIAGALGVSKSTVGRILNERVSQKPDD
jgi:hypothetical protein